MLKNPELEIKTPLIEPGIVREQSNKLKKITSQIQAAHKGEDIKWWDEVTNYFCTYYVLSGSAYMVKYRKYYMHLPAIIQTISLI